MVPETATFYCDRFTSRLPTSIRGATMGRKTQAANWAAKIEDLPDFTHCTTQCYQQNAMEAY